MNLFYSDIDMPAIDDKTIETLEEMVVNFTKMFPACLANKCREIEQNLIHTVYRKYKKNYSIYEKGFNLIYFWYIYIYINRRSCILYVYKQ